MLLVQMYVIVAQVHLLRHIEGVQNGHSIAAHVPEQQQQQQQQPPKQ
jgi:hypothetical protein